MILMTQKSCLVILLFSFLSSEVAYFLPSSSTLFCQGRNNHFRCVRAYVHKASFDGFFVSNLMHPLALVLGAENKITKREREREREREKHTQFQKSEGEIMNLFSFTGFDVRVTAPSHFFSMRSLFSLSVSISHSVYLVAPSLSIQQPFFCDTRNQEKKL